MQFPPGVPDPNYIIHQMTPLVGLLLVFTGVRWRSSRSAYISRSDCWPRRGTVRPGNWAPGKGVRRLRDAVSAGGARPQLHHPPDDAAGRAAARVHGRAVAELAERVYFAERLLAKTRDGEAGKLGPGE